MSSSRTNTLEPADKAKIAILVLMVLALPLYLLYGVARDWLDRLQVEERGYTTTTVVGAAARLRQMQEEKVTTVGMVAHVPQLPPDQFLLIRFRMTCCAADATPVAVPVRWAGAASLKDRTWVKVSGQTNPTAKAVVADKVEPAREPSNPYL
jgi:uncharacterized membrane protein YcgQ (UPF0703/DUF1980 family)